MTYDVGNPGPGLGQAQKRGRFKSIMRYQHPCYLPRISGQLNSYIIYKLWLP